jgi:hypothetical protein
MSGGEPFNANVRWVCKALGALILAAGVVLFFGGFGPDMRGDTRIFIVLLYFLPTGIGLLMIRDPKSAHIFIGIMLNVAGTLIMQTANSWAGFMMSPAGVDSEGILTGTVWQAFENHLATPIAIHRMLGNMAFGGLVAGAYAAVKFIGARTAAEKAHYDWMGYVSNLIAIAALLPLPFAGYYLGREVYSTSAVMGNNMMGGDFSWTFIIQAMLVGSLFLISNYYLWTGMTRIPGAERYYKFIKYILIALVVSFAVWLTPHNLPLTGQEVGEMGGSQYHPTLKFMGLMPAKNAVINLIILSTFFSFLLYRRANKSERVPVSEQGRTVKIVVSAVGVLCMALLGAYAYSLLALDPTTLDLAPEKSRYFVLPAVLLIVQIGVIGACAALTFVNRGIVAQAALFGVTILSVVFILGVYGFVVMTEANPFLRNIAVCQVLLVLSSLIFGSAMDVAIFRKAQQVGNIAWGRIPIRSQYTLVLLCVSIVLLMGLMGYIRSGLREDWHVYGVIRDTSQWAFTPTMAYMSKVVALCTVIFLSLVTFVFWLSGLQQKESEPDS